MCVCKEKTKINEYVFISMHQCVCQYRQAGEEVKFPLPLVSPRGDHLLRCQASLSQELRKTKQQLQQSQLQNQNLLTSLQDGHPWARQCTW